MGRWCACGWSVVQLDRDEEVVAVHRMYGTLDAELWRHTVPARERNNRPSCVSSGKLSVPRWSMWKSLMLCLERSNEMHWPKSKDADLWILLWEELHRAHQEGKLVEVEHVKAHRTKKKIKCLSSKSSSSKAGEVAKGGMAEIRASTVQQRREEVHAAPSFHCLVEEWKDCEALSPKPKEKWTFLWTKNGEAKKHRMEWCAQPSKCLSMPAKM